MAGRYIRGALVSFMPKFLIPQPNVVIFQYNPETMTHAWSQPEAGPEASRACGDPLGAKGLPGEKFNFTIAVDSGDMIADGSIIAEGIAVSTGVYSRLAAIEMLQYPVAAPTAGGLEGTVSAAASGLAGSAGAKLGGATAPAARTVPKVQVPAVLFVWGPGRIVPVRITNLSVTEKLYDPLLNPTHAEATLELRVLTPDELKAVTGPLKDIAKAAYDYTQALRRVLAVANLAEAAESIIGMLPL